MNSDDLRNKQREALARLGEMAADLQRETVSADVERRVLAAWDARAATPVASPASAWGRWQWASVGVAAACCVAAFAVVRQPAPMASVVPPSSPVGQGDDSDLRWLDADPLSLQVVYARVSSEAWEAHGLPAVDVDADGSVPVELVIGADGSLRRVRALPLLAHGEY